MVKYYLINCENRNPSTILEDKKYIHIKAHIDGKQMAIISQEEIVDENAIEKSKAELQVILDNWIDVENENPEKDIDDNDILQDKININKFVKE